jgi:urease accessory protein
MQPLPRAVEVALAGTWPGETAADRLVLPYEERHRRRLRYVAQGGTEFLLDLPRAVILRAGDGLRLTDGRIIGVEAAPEPLAKITAPDAATLVRFAWHLGNRHLPAQLASTHILIREDPVILAMLRGLGAGIEPVLAPFTPEAGAYEPTAHLHALHPLSPHLHPHDHDDA